MNKMLIMASFIITVLFLGCTGEPKNDANSTVDQTPQVAVDNSGSATNANPVGDAPYADILTLNYWVFEKYYHPDKAQKDLGKGRWFKFEKDGTFVSGRWKDQTASGTWISYAADGKIFIRIDSTIDREDAEFEIQAMTQAQDQMAWVGTAAFPNYDPVSLVTTNLLTIPTKAQFGVE